MNDSRLGALKKDGKYRENVFEQGVYSYLERYRTKGDPYEGLYCYNFGLHTNPAETQPSGAINLSKFKKVEFEFTTINYFFTIVPWYKVFLR